MIFRALEEHLRPTAGKKDGPVKDRPHVLPFAR